MLKDRQTIKEEIWKKRLAWLRENEQDWQLDEKTIDRLNDHSLDSYETADKKLQREFRQKWFYRNFLKFLWNLYKLYINIKGKKMKIDFGGQKFKAFIGGSITAVLILFLTSVLGMSEDAAIQLITIIATLTGGFIGVQGLSDSITKGKTSTVANKTNDVVPNE